MGESQLQDDATVAPASGVRGAVAVFTPGAEFGKYRVERLVGVGGMAEVYAARHTGLNKPVAIKVLKPDFLGRPEMTERFMREGESAARIQHPNVVDTVDVGQVDGVPYLVMEFIDGELLSDLLEREGPVAPSRAAALMLPVIAAVARAHAQGVVHRDLKPENVMLPEGVDGRVQPKVMDFGVSRLVDGDVGQKLTIDRGVLGTPYYMSPEQARGEPVDGRSDQYALGAMLYEAVTGKLPYEGDSILELLQLAGAGRFDPPSRHRDISPELEGLILRAMSLHPDDRYPSVVELGAALLGFGSKRVQALWGSEFSRRQVSAAASALTHNTPVNMIAQRTLNPLVTEAAPVHGSKPTPKSRAGRWVVAAAVLAAALGIGAWQTRASAGAQMPAAASKVETFAVKLMATPARSTIELDGEPVAVGTFAGQLPRDGRTHTIVVAAPGFERREIKFSDVAPPETIVLKELPAAKAPDPEPAKAKKVVRRRWYGGRARVVPTATPSNVATAPPTSEDPRRRRAASDNKDPWATK